MDIRPEVKELVKKIKRFPNREVMRSANTMAYNEGVRNAWTPMWVRNLVRSYQKVEALFAKENADMSTIPKVQGVPVIILGSGPSLDDVIPYLKDWKGAIVCSTSQMLLLEYHGITPTYCVLIDCDPNPEIIKLIGDYKGDLSKTTLITHPQIPREYFDAWKGPIKLFRMLDPGDDFSSKYVPMGVGWINQEKNWHIGSFVLNSGNVVNAAIPIMNGLGYGPIFLCGYDLGYPAIDEKVVYRGKSVTRVDGKLVENPPAPMPSMEVRPIRYYKGINETLSDELCYFYKYSFMILYGLGNMPLISCSRGLLGELPYVHPKDVVAAQGKGFEGIIRNAHENYIVALSYLKARSIYILKTDFHVETVNIYTKKSVLDRMSYRIRHAWLSSRPWVWKGDRIGFFTAFYRTYSIQRKDWKKKRDEKRAADNMAKKQAEIEAMKKELTNVGA
jgi:hypothetical protein